MIDPNAISTERVGQLATAPFNLTDEIPHEVSGKLKKGNIQALSDFIANILEVSNGAGYLPINISNGQQLPSVPLTPSFILVGAGTFLNVNGFSDLICSEELNVLMSLDDHWEIAVEIPINVDVSQIGISQSINSGVTNLAPSENAVFNALNQYLNSVGSLTYADLATQTTPLSGVANTELNLTNDTDGTNTDVSNAPYGVGATWDSTINKIDFSQLSVGDLVTITVDLKVTTTSANQNVSVYVRLGLGTASEKDILIGKQLVKPAGEFVFNEELSIPLNKLDWITDLGEIYLISEHNSTVKVQEFNFIVLRKNINIVDVFTDEAPIDGNIYGRKDAGWEEITGGGSTTIVTKTKAEIDTLISGNDLVPLTVYEITGVDIALYGGSTIYLQAINDNTLATEGYGKFYNPKYNQAVNGFDVWTSAGSYSIGDKVHWGGKTWENVDGNVGASTDLFTLNSEWSIIAFNSTDYNLVYDLIKYDYANDVIIYRNEKNNNIVSTSYDNINYWDYSPIKVFMWGNTYDDDSFGHGIGDQIINNSYNENINFRGSRQLYLTFNNGSYQNNISFDNSSHQQNLTFDNGSRQTDLTFDNSSRQDYLTFDNYSSQGSLTFDNSNQSNLTFDNGSNQAGLTFNNGSRQSNVSFDNYSSQGSLTFNNSFQQFSTFDNYSSQTNLTFDNSNQSNLTFENGSSQNNLTETTGLNQQNISFNNYQFDRTANPLASNEIGLMFNGTLPTSTTATKMIVAEDGQWKEMNIDEIVIPKKSFNIFEFVGKGFGNTDLTDNEVGDVFRGWSNDGTIRYTEALWLGGDLDDSDNFTPLVQTGI